jgi:hypothetical protein
MKNFFDFAFVLLLVSALLILTVSIVKAQDYVDPGTASFVWDAPADGGSPTGYNLKIGTATGVYTMAKSTTGLSMAMSQFTLTQRTTYFAVVSAFNEAGESENSNELVFIPLAKPGQPTIRMQK